WRTGQTNHLQSGTARAVLFSALTTMAAFGSLALSPDPGTAEMGMLLSISLFCTLFCALIVLPALLGPVEAPVTEPLVAEASATKAAVAQAEDRLATPAENRVERSARLRRVGGGRR
ncbi:MAG TPA: MMPL family transporter, partial [Stellaceae bacterium]|nr:MMPL family transporter [Stellaceae bacterium]